MGFIIVLLSLPNTAPSVVPGSVSPSRKPRLICIAPFPTPAAVVKFQIPHKIIQHLILQYNTQHASISNECLHNLLKFTQTTPPYTNNKPFIVHLTPDSCDCQPMKFANNCPTSGQFAFSFWAVRPFPILQTLTNATVSSWNLSVITTYMVNSHLSHWTFRLHSFNPKFLPTP